VAQARPDKVKALIAIEPAASAIPPKSTCSRTSDADRLRDYIGARFTLAEDPCHRHAFRRRHQGRAASVDVVPASRHQRQFAHADDDKNNAEVAA